MSTTPSSTGEQLRLLAGGLVLLAGLLTIATVADTQSRLSLVMGAALLVIALVGSWRGSPRILVLITAGFGLTLLAAALLQVPAHESRAAIIGLLHD